MTYSRFINGLNKAGIEIDRKVLAAIAYDDAASFAEIVSKVQAALEATRGSVGLSEPRPLRPRRDSTGTRPDDKGLPARAALFVCGVIAMTTISSP